MSEIADSMLFRQKLYDTFKESGLLSKLKTTLRTNLLQKL
jgi:isochorismate hydrolase